MIGNLVFCEDCAVAAVNDDYSALDYYYNPEEAVARYNKIRDGLTRLGHVMWDSTRGEDEFSTRPCDCCGTKLAGRRMYFIVDN